MAATKSANLYEGYAEAKGWNGEDSVAEFPFFDHLATRAGMKPGRLLEVGFGEGRLLDWAKARGYHASGNDILTSMVEAAHSRGLDVRLGVLKAGDFAECSFDWIVAMDVLEHLTTEQIIEHLDSFPHAVEAGRQGGRAVPQRRQPLLRRAPIWRPHTPDPTLAGVPGPARRPRRHEDYARAAP